MNNKTILTAISMEEKILQIGDNKKNEIIKKI